MKASEPERLVKYFLQLSVLALWKSFTTISAPFARILAFYVWVGRAGFKVTAWLQRVLLKLVGWLGSPAFERSHWLRQWSRNYMPGDVRRWHLIVGERLLGSSVVHGVSWLDRPSPPHPLMPQAPS